MIQLLKTCLHTLQQTYMKATSKNTIVWFQKISIPPPPQGRDRIFQGGGGVNLPNFPKGEAGHHREIFPEGSRDARRVTKKKHKKLPQQLFICEYIKHYES